MLAFGRRPRNDINAADLYGRAQGFWSRRASRVHAPSAKGRSRLRASPCTPGGAPCSGRAPRYSCRMALRSMRAARARAAARPLGCRRVRWVRFPLSAAERRVDRRHRRGLVVPAPTAATPVGALSGAVFVVKTTKRIIFSEARHRGGRARTMRGGRHARLRHGRVRVHFALEAGHAARARGAAHCGAAAARRRFVAVTHANGDGERR